MNSCSIDAANDADLRLSAVALRRAALRARELAEQTGTAVVVLRNGVLEHINPRSEAAGIQEPETDYGKSPSG